jgi:hypothetical protein
MNISWIHKLSFPPCLASRGRDYRIIVSGSALLLRRSARGESNISRRSFGKICARWCARHHGNNFFLFNETLNPSLFEVKKLWSFFPSILRRGQQVCNMIAVFFCLSWCTSDVSFYRCSFLLYALGKSLTKKV